MIRQQESLLNWNYFLALESDLDKVSRYIEFNKKNEKVYSIELAHLLLASSSEVDVVAKEICKLINPSDKSNNINSYRSVITSHLPEFTKEIVYIPRYGLDFKPWTNWKKGQNPFWWQSYNNVKHQRSDHFYEASLKNVLNSMGGLLTMCFYYYKLKFRKSDPNSYKADDDIMIRLNPESKLIRLSSHYYPIISIND